MVLYDASGIASGSSTSTGDVAITFYMSGAAQGTSTTSATVSTSFSLGGRAQGTSFAIFDNVQDASGIALGGSTLTALSTQRILRAAGRAFGTSLTSISMPSPALGTSRMVAHMEVIRHKPPVNAIATPPKTFRWLQLLHQGDLALYLCDFGGGYVGAISVHYALIQVRADGSRKRVGPQNRVPAKGRVGEYYATGLAGEAGQPGKWFIEWRYQVSSGDPVQVVEQEFRVQDAVMAADPQSKLDRKIKFGWN